MHTILNSCNNQCNEQEREAVQNLCIAINLTSSMIVYGDMSLQEAVGELRHLYNGAETMLETIVSQRSNSKG
jgi:hypothetical protein